MIRLLFSLTAFLLISCGHSVPQANLEFLSIQKKHDYVEIAFKSNVNLDSIFKENKNQRPVFSELICSLDDNTNLEFDQHLNFFANGTITGIRVDSVKKNYYFKTSMLFWRAPVDQSGSNIMLTNEEVVNLIRKRASIPCLYRMTIYLSKPYYTKQMNIPTKELLQVLNSPHSRDSVESQIRSERF